MTDNPKTIREVITETYNLVNQMDNILNNINKDITAIEQSIELLFNRQERYQVMMMEKHHEMMNLITAPRIVRMD